MGRPRGTVVTLDEFFAGDENARALYEVVRTALGALEGFEERVTVSQVAWRRRRSFAWAWRPGRYLSGEAPPLVLTVALPRRDGSSRWKQVAEPRPGLWVHHLELHSAEQIDAEVRGWLVEAWAAAE